MAAVAATGAAAAPLADAAEDIEAAGAAKNTADGVATAGATAGAGEEGDDGHVRGSARLVHDDKTLKEGEVPWTEDDYDPDAAAAAAAAGLRYRADDAYADLDPQVYRRLRPAGKALARILDEAMYPDPEEEPIYYWDDDFEGDPNELTTAQIAFHNAHWAGYRTMKGAETVGEFFAGFLGITNSRYQWVIDAKKRDDERAKQEELENRQRRWLIAQAKLRRESMEAQRQLAKAGEMESGGGGGGGGGDGGGGGGDDGEN